RPMVPVFWGISGSTRTTWRSWGTGKTSGTQAVEHAREGDRLPDVGDTGHPRHGPLQTEAKARVGDRAVPAKIQVPLVVFLGQAMLGDPTLQDLHVLFPL